MNRRAISLLATVGLAAGLVTASAGGAAAYPPGTALTLVASPHPVVVNNTVTARASHVQLGCSVRFVLVGLAKTVGSTSGTATTTYRAPAKPGAYLMSATTVGTNCTVERAYTYVVVKAQSANVTAPARVRAHGIFRVTVTGFPARHWVWVRISGKGVTVVQHRMTNPAGAAVMFFRLTWTRAYLVTANSGRIYARTVVTIVR